MGKFKEALKDFQQVFCLQLLASMCFLSSFFFFLVDKYGDNHFNISPDKYLKIFGLSCKIFNATLLPLNLTHIIDFLN